MASAEAARRRPVFVFNAVARGYAVSPGSFGLGTSFGAFGFSSGALPTDRRFINLFKVSNQNGAPNDAANPVNNHPRRWKRKVCSHKAPQLMSESVLLLIFDPGHQPGHSRSPSTG